jgi:hypothetical protein
VGLGFTDIYRAEVHGLDRPAGDKTAPAHGLLNPVVHSPSHSCSLIEF